MYITTYSSRLHYIAYKMFTKEIMYNTVLLQAEIFFEICQNLLSHVDKR
jgi:hypothetical protein